MLKEIINKKGINQTELAKKLKIDRATLNRYINDNKSLLKAPLQNLLNICKELNVSLEDISIDYLDLKIVKDNKDLNENVNTMLDLSVKRIENYFGGDEKRFLKASIENAKPNYTTSLKFYFQLSINDFIQYNQEESSKYSIDKDKVIEKINKLEELDLLALIRNLN